MIDICFILLILYCLCPPSTQSPTDVAINGLNSALNKSIDPCDDFYAFACGGWIAKNPIPPELTAHGYFYELKEKVSERMKDLFEEQRPSTSRAINQVKLNWHKCMDTEAINTDKSQPLLSALSSLGYWPLLHGEKWSSDSYNFTTLIAGITRTRYPNGDYLFYAGADVDPMNVTLRRMYFDQGSTEMGSRDYYLDSVRHEKHLAAYERYILGVARLLANDSGVVPDEDGEKLAQEVHEMVEFEKLLAGISFPIEQRRNASEMYHLVRLSKMRELLPQVNWDPYFSLLVLDCPRHRAACKTVSRFSLASMVAKDGV